MKKGPGGLWIPDDDNHSEVIANCAKRYHQFIKTGSIKRNGIAIDGGAHVGYWTLMMATDFELVVTIEPHPDNSACLLRNVQESRANNIWMINKALGPLPDKCYIEPGVGAKAGNSGAQCVRHDPLKRQEISMISLDSLSLSGPVNLLKLDIEGYEYPTLLGGETLIKEHHPAIIIELNTAASENYGWDDERPRKLLESWNYKEVMRSGKDSLYMRIV